MREIDRKKKIVRDRESFSVGKGDKEGDEESEIWKIPIVSGNLTEHW